MDVDKQLGFLKQQCENVDSELLILLKRRFQTERRMVEARLKNGMEAQDRDRDVEVIDYVLKKSREMGISDTFIHSLYGVIMDYSETVQKEYIDSQSKK